MKTSSSFADKSILAQLSLNTVAAHNAYRGRPAIFDIEDSSAAWQAPVLGVSLCQSGDVAGMLTTDFEGIYLDGEWFLHIQIGTVRDCHRLPEELTHWPSADLREFLAGLLQMKLAGASWTTIEEELMRVSGLLYLVAA